MSAQLATRRMSEAEFAALETAHAAFQGSAAARVADASFYANERFHYAIYSASPNTFLSEQAAALQRKLRPYRRCSCAFVTGFSDGMRSTKRSSMPYS